MFFLCENVITCYFWSPRISTEKPGKRNCFIKQNIPPFMSQRGLVLFQTERTGLEYLTMVKSWHWGGTFCLSLAGPLAWGRRPERFLYEVMEVLTSRWPLEDLVAGRRGWGSGGRLQSMSEAKCSRQECSNNTGYNIRQKGHALGCTF